MSEPDGRSPRRREGTVVAARRGLNYTDYSEKVADVNVVYNDIDYGSDPDQLGCITDVGLPLEKAVNQYVSAYRVWNGCFEDINCDNDSIDGALQSRWAKAGKAVDRAYRALQRLEDATGRAKARVARTKAGLAAATEELRSARSALE